MNQSEPIAFQTERNLQYIVKKQLQKGYN